MKATFLFLFVACLTPQAVSQTQTHFGTGDNIVGTKIENNTYIIGDTSHRSILNNDKPVLTPPDDCINKTTGNLCFVNKTNERIKIGLYPGNSSHSVEFVGYITLGPGQTSCFYDLALRAYHYGVTKNVPNFYLAENFITEGGAQAEKCKVVSIDIY